MQIVNEEQDRATLCIGLEFVDCIWLARLSRSFRKGARPECFEERDFPRRVVDLQLKLFGFQATDEAPVFIEDHHVGLDERGLKLDYVFGFATRGR
jgi:hypothetical protein